ADGCGKRYVADITNAPIQKFSHTGTFLTKRGSHGSGEGQFLDPEGVAVDGSGNVFVANRGNYRIQKFTNTGTFLTKWGFANPTGVAVDGSGNVFVADFTNDLIQNVSTSVPYLTDGRREGGGDGPCGSPIGDAVEGGADVLGG